MKFKCITILVFQLLLLSCSNTISSVKKEYTLKSASKIKSAWNIDSKEWSLKNDTLIGNGGPMHWGVIMSKKDLPENYEINFKVNITKESLFEVMLNTDKENYIRTYLYQIDQNMIIGKGTYHKNNDEYGKRGGPTLLKKAIELTNNKWYGVTIKVINNQLSFSVDNKMLECSLVEKNLSQKGKIGFITNGEVKVTDLNIKTIE